MAYRFASNSDTTEFAIAPLAAYMFGAHTVALLLKRNTLNSAQIVLETYTTGFADQIYVDFNTSNSFGIRRGVNSYGPQSLNSTSVWYLLVITGTGGTGGSRFHVHDGTSWSHQAAASGSGSNITMNASDKLFIGAGFNTPLVDIVCAAVKKADSTDGQVETLSRTQFQAWRDFGFDWLIGFDSSLLSAGKLQDQGAPGTGDELARAGTTQVSDPPGWAWVSTVTPVADFTGTPLTGSTPLSVAFTDTSTNVPTSWLWNFGDGATSTAQNPSHNYTVPGVYTVSLTATNAGGSNTKTRSAYVTVAVPNPVADFTGTPLSGLTPLIVSFTDTSTNFPASWLWDFGDGSTSTAQNPSHSYAAPGTYTVKLTAINASGTSTKIRTAYITASKPPVALVSGKGATFKQTEVQNPHLRLPLQFGGIKGGAVVNEQDTGEDIVDCIKAIVAYEIGTRIDLPEFGIPDVLFRQYSDLYVGQIRVAIEEWEDRAIIDVDGGFELTDTMIWDILVKAGVSGG